MLLRSANLVNTIFSTSKRRKRPRASAYSTCVTESRGPTIHRPVASVTPIRACTVWWLAQWRASQFFFCDGCGSNVYTDIVYGYLQRAPRRPRHVPFAVAQMPNKGASHRPISCRASCPPSSGARSHRFNTSLGRSRAPLVSLNTPLVHVRSIATRSRYSWNRSLPSPACGLPP
jgi:hypothetical protein